MSQQEVVYRYYCLYRPPMLGTVPRGMFGWEDYTERTYCPQIDGYAWGHVEYEKPLSDGQIANYELQGPELVPIVRGGVK